MNTLTQETTAVTEATSNAHIGDLVTIDGFTGQLEVLDFVNGHVRLRSRVHGWDRFYPVS